jgi:hypothetical protein
MFERIQKDRIAQSLRNPVSWFDQAVAIAAPPSISFDAFLSH